MSRVSLAKYGFVRTPRKDFTYNGERYYWSRAVFNGCEIDSAVCRYRGGDRVSCNFYIGKVNGKSMLEVNEYTRNMWYELESKADLKRFDDICEVFYTQRAVDEFMEKLYNVTAILSQLIL